MRELGKHALAALLLFTMLVCGLLMDSFAETGKIISENGGKVNIRKAPEDKARIVTRIRNGETVEVLEHDGNWYHVRFKGKEDYIKEQFVILLSAMIGKNIYSNGVTLYLREKPNDQSAIISMINSQQSMKIEQIDEELMRRRPQWSGRSTTC